MKGFFSKDSVLKVISFVIAIMIWFYVIIVVDPSVDITIRDIPVRYVNQTALENNGLSVINDGTAVCELKVRGSRKKIANIDNKNVYATVDLSSIGRTGTFSLPISISIPYEYNEIVSKKPYNIEVAVDRIIEKEVEIKVVSSGSVANGYIAGEPVTSSKSVILKGPLSLVNSIGGVAATLSYGDRAAEIKDTEKLYFTDSSGKPVDKDNNLYDKVGMDLSAIEIYCPVMKLKTVPVKAVFDDETKIENFKISVQPSNITIYAENEILSEVAEIETALLNANTLLEDGTAESALVLPEGVYLRDGIKSVTVKAEPKG